MPSAEREKNANETGLGEQQVLETLNRDVMQYIH